MIKEIKPIKESSEEYEKIEKEILKVFKEEIYLPLLKELNTNKTVLNTKEDLLNAIQKGQISFNRGKFTGSFNAGLSRELKSLGAKWNKDGWSIPANLLPIEVKNAIATSVVRFDSLLEKINARIRQILPQSVAEKVKLQPFFDKTLWKVESELQKSTKNITIVPKLTEQQAQRISDEYTTNLRKYIKDFTEKEVIELRQRISKTALEGRRHESLVKIISKRYEVSENKAKFLARQETALMMAKFKETRYEDAGIKYYKWRSVAGSKSHPVRKRHKELNDESLKGKLFRFDDPPITTEKGEPQRRNNPGEDYNCRCSAIPVVKF